MRGLEGAGVEPVPIRVEPPAVLRAAAFNAVAAAHTRPSRDLVGAIQRGRAAAWASPQLAAVNSWAAPWRLRQAGPLDAIVQIGTGYTLETPVPIATFEDMTVAQTRGHSYVGWEDLTDGEFASRMERQRRAYRQAVACCLTTPWAAESVIRDYGIEPAKVHVVGVGFNHDAGQGHRDWSRPRFLFVGMDWARKNGAGVLRAFARLRDELPAALLDVVGRHPRLDQPGVTGHGVLHLNVAEERARLDRLFGSATCFVMPSYSEASAISYVEAVAAGVPSIGTTSGGSGYLIGREGLMVDPRDDDSLLAAMRRLSDPVTAARLGAAAKRRAVDFTWTAVAQRLLRALGD
jgi:glycosyltransferase involved in cell wall biosynthesis